MTSCYWCYRLSYFTTYPVLSNRNPIYLFRLLAETAYLKTTRCPSLLTVMGSYWRETRYLYFLPDLRSCTTTSHFFRRQLREAFLAAAAGERERIMLWPPARGEITLKERLCILTLLEKKISRSIE